jgi:hypothetical protein
MFVNTRNKYAGESKKIWSLIFWPGRHCYNCTPQEGGLLQIEEHNEVRLVLHVDLCHPYFQGPQIKDMKVGCICNSTAQLETRVDFLWEIQKMTILIKQILDIYIVRILHGLKQAQKMSK